MYLLKAAPLDDPDAGSSNALAIEPALVHMSSSQILQAASLLLSPIRLNDKTIKDYVSQYAELSLHDTAPPRSIELRFNDWSDRAQDGDPWLENVPIWPTINFLVQLLR